MSRCCICRRPVEDENAPILTMTGYGNPRYVCKDCEAKIDEATNGTEPDKIEAAYTALGEILTASNTDEMSIISSVNEIIKNAAERCEAIRAGEYDFSKDNGKENAEEEFEITEDIMETEEDRAQDEHDARVSKKVDTVISWAAGIILAAAVIFLIIRFVF